MAEEQKEKKREYAKNRSLNIRKEQREKRNEYAKNWFHKMTEEQRNKRNKYKRNEDKSMLIMNSLIWCDLAHFLKAKDKKRLIFFFFFFCVLF